MTQRKRVAILISGRGSNMTALIAAAKAPDYPAEIVGVFSNRADAPGLATAAAAGIPTAVRSHKDYPDRESFDAEIGRVLAGWNAELVCLAGFMRIFSRGFAASWTGRMLNIHPSLLPLFKGLKPQQQALDAGVSESGCSVHWVIPDLDDGPTILQRRVPVLPGDTAETLGERILIEEHKAYPEALAMVARDEATLAPSAPVIRRLTTSDAAAYRDLRLEALQNAPTAFGSSYEAESQNSLSDFEGHLTRSYIVGAWLEGSLVGVTGFYSLSGKAAHRGNIWGVYVQPQARGRGISRALLTEILSSARTQVKQVHLSVVTDNATALALYERLGFTIYGTEPRSLFVEGRYLDEHMMVLRFD
ncbi:MAG: phosphoribosylglycinamide formyltransferase [Devosia sp.]